MSLTANSPTRDLLIRLAVAFVSLCDAAVDRVGRLVAARRARGALRGATGQATTEYALVLLAAALVALLVIAWASAGGGAARISRLFNRVIDAVIERV